MRIPKRYRFVGGMAVLAITAGVLTLFAIHNFQPAHALGNVYTVTNTGDNGGVNPAVGAGTGTLRQAIVDANAAALLGGEPHNIRFAIPGTGVQTITLQTVLPQITKSTIIDGTTQSSNPSGVCGTLVDPKRRRHNQADQHPT